MAAHGSGLCLAILFYFSLPKMVDRVSCLPLPLQPDWCNICSSRPIQLGSCLPLPLHPDWRGMPSSTQSDCHQLLQISHHLVIQGRLLGPALPTEHSENFVCTLIVVLLCNLPGSVLLPSCLFFFSSKPAESGQGKQLQQLTSFFASLVFVRNTR